MINRDFRWGLDCYCDNTFQNGGSPQPGSTECWSSCWGNIEQPCGGWGSGSLYKKCDGNCRQLAQAQSQRTAEYNALAAAGSAPATPWWSHWDDPPLTSYAPYYAGQTGSIPTVVAAASTATPILNDPKGTLLYQASPPHTVQGATAVTSSLTATAASQSVITPKSSDPVNVVTSTLASTRKKAAKTSSPAAAVQSARPAKSSNPIKVATSASVSNQASAAVNTKLPIKLPNPDKVIDGPRHGSGHAALYTVTVTNFATNVVTMFVAQSQ